MSGTVTITQTDTGWLVEADEADRVIVETRGKSILVAVHPDDDDTPKGKPLAVALG